MARTQRQLDQLADRVNGIAIQVDRFILEAAARDRETDQRLRDTDARIQARLWASSCGTGRADAWRNLRSAQPGGLGGRRRPRACPTTTCPRVYPRDAEAFSRSPRGDACRPESRRLRRDSKTRSGTRPRASFADAGRQSPAACYLCLKNSACAVFSIPSGPASMIARLSPAG